MSEDPTGTTALVMTFFLSLLVAFYLSVTGRRMDARPEDRKEAEIVEGAGELGFFPPYSWWPLYCALHAGGGRPRHRLRLVAVHRRLRHRHRHAERLHLRVLPRRPRSLVASRYGNRSLEFRTGQRSAYVTSTAGRGGLAVLVTSQCVGMTVGRATPCPAADRITGELRVLSSTVRKHGLAVAGICAMLLVGTACSDTEAGVGAGRGGLDAEHSTPQALRRTPGTTAARRPRTRRRRTSRSSRPRARRRCSRTSR